MHLLCLEIKNLSRPVTKFVQQFAARIGAQGGPLMQYRFMYGYTPLRASSGLVVIS